MNANDEYAVLLVRPIESRGTLAEAGVAAALAEADALTAMLASGEAQAIGEGKPRERKDGTLADGPSSLKRCADRAVALAKRLDTDGWVREESPTTGKLVRKYRGSVTARGGDIVQAMLATGSSFVLPLSTGHTLAVVPVDMLIREGAAAGRVGLYLTGMENATASAQRRAAIEAGMSSVRALELERAA